MTALDSPFPHRERIVYERNPLNEVICQVRFPPLLRLQAQTPFEFQEAIQDRFPVYGEGGPQVELPPQLVQLLGSPLRTSNHKFLSEDGLWSASLESHFLALTCGAYESWQKFSEVLFDILSKLNQIYKPSFFNRIGLRYQNTIKREWLGNDADWADYINPSLVGPLADRQLEDRIKEARASMLISLNAGIDAVHFQHGLASLDDNQTRCYLLDFDYYTDERTDTEDATNVISRLYSYSGPAFQWAITPRLHEAMGPRE